MSQRPGLIFLCFSLLLGLGAGATLLLFKEYPRASLIGVPSRHDPALGKSDARAFCLDCHVPFVGSPSSRCLGPGCHSDLATGTPPQTGPALPVRFHQAIRNYECSLCHEEHRPERLREFSHALIPSEVRGQCQRCHLAQDQQDHDRTNQMDCALCHRTDDWKITRVDHRVFKETACDVCHLRPESEAHAKVAGSCNVCHNAQIWTPKAK